jgi:hypothetical protein
MTLRLEVVLAGISKQKSVSPPEELLHPKEFLPGGADRVGHQK